MQHFIYTLIYHRLGYYFHFTFVALKRRHIDVVSRPKRKMAMASEYIRAVPHNNNTFVNC